MKLDFSTLTPAQREAVTTIEGPVMVIAGPGTGKTHVLTLRIANIIAETDTPPDGILALTFTESGAATMRRRLAKLIGNAAYHVRIHTFHGYAKTIIDRYPEYFSEIIGGEIITDLEKVTLMRRIIEGRSWEHLKPYGNNHYYVSPALGAISELKRENCTPEELKARVQKELDGAGDEKEVVVKKLERTLELAEAYTLYQQELHRLHRYDFDDMLMRVVRTLEKEEGLLRVLQEESLYILADEHQDANGAQNRLLELLADFHESPNLFIVGDDKQAIYRFQGASLENFLYFKHKFKDARLVVLAESFRSHQGILDTAQALAVRADKLKADTLTARGSGLPQRPRLITLPTREQELAFVAHEIQGLVASRVVADTIAILYRKNSEGFAMREALAREGVLCQLHGASAGFQDPDVLRFRALLAAVADPSTDEVVLGALHLPSLPIERVDVFALAKAARVKSVALRAMLASGAYRKEYCSDPDAAERTHRILLHAERHTGTVLEMMETLMHESGLVNEMIKRPDAAEAFDALRGLFAHVETRLSQDPRYAVRDLMHDLQLMDEHHLRVSTQHAARAGYVQLMTAHRAKGMEFEHVYVINVVDGVWGGNRDRSLFALGTGAARGDDEDEMRLLFVALTRAKRHLTVSFGGASADKELLPSRLLSEIAPELFDHSQPEVDATPRFVVPRIPITDAERRFVTETFREQGLSVTALNNYLSCPWKYFYSSLVRVPTSPSKELEFGKAAHAALRDFFDAYAKEKVVPNVSVLIDRFKAVGALAPLASEVRDALIERGAGFLEGWYARWSGSWAERTKSEVKMEVTFDREGTDPVRLRGDLDKIEIAEDGKRVSVVDYKTGKPKTRNALLGKTKDESGPNYYRQLVFYKLLLELDGRYTFKDGTIDFLQPSDSGKYTKESFEISDGEVAALRTEIARVSEEIEKVAFWDTQCDDKECAWCALRTLSTEVNSVQG